jgi:bacillithiol biosynthesis deacetylase BshB1
MKLDALAIGAHPDDIELSVSGTFIKLAERGYRVGVVDMVRGELGSRGTPAIRAREAKAAAEIMGLSVRENLRLKDGSIFDTPEARLRVVRVLRKYRPDLVFTHYWDDRHPDHIYTSRIVAQACYLSGLAKIDTKQERFRPARIFYFMIPHTLQPTFFVDITGQFDKKIQAVKAFQSQLFDPKSLEPQTYLSVPEFLPALETLNRYYGTLIQAKYAEAFYCKEALAVDDPVRFFAGKGQAL